MKRVLSYLASIVLFVAIYVICDDSYFGFKLTAKPFFSQNTSQCEISLGKAMLFFKSATFISTTLNGLLTYLSENHSFTEFSFICPSIFAGGWVSIVISIFSVIVDYFIPSHIRPICATFHSVYSSAFIYSF